MIPIDDNIPNRDRPIMTFILIGLNVAILIVELNLEVTGRLSDFLHTWGVVSDRVASLIADVFTNPNPAAFVALIVMSAGSLIISLFLHSSFSHILGNMLFLWVFGKRVEQILGGGRFLVFYLICGLLTEIGQIAIDPTLSVPLIGSNGAIAAILGAYILNFPKAKIETLLPLFIIFVPLQVPAFFYLVWWFVQQIFYGIGKLTIVGGVNPMSIGYWSHGIGVIIGASLVSWMMKGMGNTYRETRNKEM